MGPGWVDRTPRVGPCLVGRRLHVGSIYVVTQVCQPYIGPISPLCWSRLAYVGPRVGEVSLEGRLCEPILALAPPEVGPCRPYDSLCSCHEAPTLGLCHEAPTLGLCWCYVGLMWLCWQPM